MNEAPYHKLPPSLRPTAYALARVILPEEMEILGITEDIIDHVELTLDSFPSHYRTALLIGMSVFDASAAFYPPARGRAFRALEPEVAERWFEAWWSCPFEPLSAFPKGIKAVFALAYYDHPMIRERLEYHPDAWIAKVARRRFEKYAQAIEEEERKVTTPSPLTDGSPKGERKIAFTSSAGKEWRHA